MVASVAYLNIIYCLYRAAKKTPLFIMFLLGQYYNSNFSLFSLTKTNRTMVYLDIVFACLNPITLIVLFHILL